jgi:protein-S-isoprenylcysteine O-methyltransferase Ste14
MNKKLFISAITKFLFGVLLVGLFIFLPAFTLNFVNGWIFMGVLFIPMFIVGIVMMVKNPALLESRLEAKEKETAQSVVVKLSGLIFVSGFVIAGLDYRFNWLQLPVLVSVISAFIFLLGYIMYAEVLRENTYLSRTIKVQEGQKVIDEKLYGVVRHPMYLATVIMFLAIPLILGSLIAFFIFLAYPFLIGIRIVNEEKVLSKELDGYLEYKEKVKYRLIPFIW